MIYWLHDFRLKDWLGGAQLTTQHMLDETPFEVQMVYPDIFKRDEISGSLLILSNTGLFKRGDLQWIVDTQRYIKFDRDVSFCNHRHALDHDCRIDCRETLSFYTRLFQRSLLNIFLSPLQANLYCQYMSLKQDKIWHCPAPIDVDRFHYTGPKEEMYLAVGEDAYHKGTDLIKKEFGDRLTFIGGNHKVAYNEMPKWFHRAKYFVHKPRVIEAFCRAVAEAYCAGCKLIVNDRIGFLSYDWDYNDRDFIYDQLRNSPQRFWERIGRYDNS